MYLSPDPIGLAGGIRPNAYVHNPTTYIDPLGLSEVLSDVSVTYRGDTRSPQVIFAEGFKAKGTSNDLWLHGIDNKKPPSNYISTSKEFGVARLFVDMSGGNGWVYEIHNSGNGIDLNESLKNRPYPNAWEEEVSYKKIIKPENIISATEIKDGKIVANIRNKNFKPTSSVKICRK